MYNVHPDNWFYRPHCNLTLENNTVLYSTRCFPCLHSYRLPDPDNPTISLIRGYLMKRSRSD